MSTDLHKISIGMGKYIGYGRGAVVDALLCSHESEITQFYVSDIELEDLCENIFDQFLTGDRYRELDWRTEMETLANIIQAVTKDGNCTFELW